MPNLRSAKKRMRIEQERRARNASVKSTVRTYVTKARNAIASDAEAPQTEEAIRTAISNLDRAVSKGVLHANNAARRKSRLMARLHKAQTEQALTNLTHLLEAASGTLDDVVRVMIYLSDMRYFQGMNNAYKKFFFGDSLPSRATVTGSFGIPELLVEFDVIAYIDNPKVI